MKIISNHILTRRNAQDLVNIVRDEKQKNIETDRRGRPLRRTRTEEIPVVDSTLTLQLVVKHNESMNRKIKIEEVRDFR